MYWNLGMVYARLGRSAEALEAYRYGRDLSPDSVAFYRGISIVYSASGDQDRAAVALVEETLVSRNAPPAILALRELYGKIRGGSCAIDYTGSQPVLDATCPRVRQDFCQASADLVQVFREARQTDRAREIKQTATQRYACPAGAF